MNTPWGRNGFRSFARMGIAAALAVAAMTTLGHGQGRPGRREGARQQGIDLREMNKRLPTGQQVLYVEPPLADEDYVLPPRLAHRADQLELMPAGIPLVNIRQLDDAAIARGSVATGFETGDPAVFMANTDSGYFFPNKSGDIGNFMSAGLIFDPLLFIPGQSITAYEFVVFNSSGGPSGPATLNSELWTGDVLGALDTVCGDPPTMIAGTSCTFSGIPDGAASPCPAGPGGTAAQPCAAVPHLLCELPAKTAIPCDRVWLLWEAVAGDGGCRVGWRLQSTGLGIPATINVTPPEIGTEFQFLGAFDCGQNNLCGASTDNDGCAVPANGRQCGTCCDNSGATANLPCDFTDGVNECSHPTFCTDGDAEQLLAADYAPGSGSYAAYLATVYTTPLVSIITVPTGNAPDGGDAGDAPDFVNGAFVRNGNELVLKDANSKTWAFLEYRIEDWDPVEGTLDDNRCPPDLDTPDPNDVVRCERIRAYHVSLDPASFGSGLAGTLAPKVVPCTAGDATPCTAAFGQGSNCDFPAACSDPDCACEFIFINTARGSVFDPDPVPYVFQSPPHAVLSGVDLVGFRFGATLNQPNPVTDPDPYPATGLYLGNFVLDVPSDARGTFTIAMDPGSINVTRETSDFIPLLGTRPAFITVETGKCCRGIGTPNITCEDGLLAKECTGPGRIFQEGAVCTGNIYCDCYLCFGHETCADENACTVDRCVPATCACTNTPVSGPGQCCDPATKLGSSVDIEGGGTVCTLDDGNSCTEDSCDAAGRCVHTSVGCPDDGIFCTGPEVCDPQLGCESAGNPCALPEHCNETLDRCECDVPDVFAAGERYLEITPQPTDSTVPMALVVRPACAAGALRYVGMPAGPLNVAMLVDNPNNAAQLTPAQWGTVYVAGGTVVPGTGYEVQVDCRGPANPAPTAAVSVETPIWGDVVAEFVQGSWQPPNGVVNIIDVTAILEAFRHSAMAPPLYRADIWGCVPDQDPAIIDAVGALDGFRHISFTRSTGCPDPCP